MGLAGKRRRRFELMIKLMYLFHSLSARLTVQNNPICAIFMSEYNAVVINTRL